MDNYKSDTDFKRLIDSIMNYSDYSFFNSLLIDYQCPYYLDLNTLHKYTKENIKLLDNANKIQILSPENITYVSVNINNQITIKLIDELSSEELKKYYDPKDKTIIFHHTDFKGLNIIDLYDCKDTNMKKENYITKDPPPLFYSDYKDIYNSFVKALYTNGYKIIYCDNMKNKFFFDKESKTINIKNGLNYKMKIMCILDVFSSDITSNEFDKKLFEYAINNSLGIEDNFVDKVSLLDWYKESNIEDVERTFKLLSTKGRKFINNFNKFYQLELKEIKSIDLNQNVNISI